jgi:curved DNA-binding protein CbpA
VSDRVFWDQLGLRRGAARGEIRRAYHRLARKHHPDIFPEQQKPLQELKMIALNEAYAYLMRLSRLSTPDWSSERAQAAEPNRRGSPGRASETGAAPSGAGARDYGPAAPSYGPAPPTYGPAPLTYGLALHRDPSYVTYKQGFVHYSRALQGIEALYRSMSRTAVRVEVGPSSRPEIGPSFRPEVGPSFRPEVGPSATHFEPRDDAYQRFAAGLSELRQAHEYFSRVVQDYEQSIWRRDAEVKLGRIERFTLLYRRIVQNLGIHS